MVQYDSGGLAGKIRSTDKEEVSTQYVSFISVKTIRNRVVITVGSNVFRKS